MSPGGGSRGGSCRSRDGSGRSRGGSGGSKGGSGRARGGSGGFRGGSGGFRGQVNPGLGQAEPGLGQAEPGVGQVDPGVGQVDPGVGQVDPGPSPGAGDLQRPADALATFVLQVQVSFFLRVCCSKRNLASPNGSRLSLNQVLDPWTRFFLRANLILYS